MAPKKRKVSYVLHNNIGYSLNALGRFAEGEKYCRAAIEMDWVRASTVHPRGRIASAWKREGEAVIYDITIPANTSALVFLPEGGTVTEGGKPLPDAWRLKETYQGTQGFRIVAGTYQFEWRKE